MSRRRRIALLAVSVAVIVLFSLPWILTACGYETALTSPPIWSLIPQRETIERRSTYEGNKLFGHTYLEPSMRYEAEVLYIGPYEVILSHRAGFIENSN